MSIDSINNYTSYWAGDSSDVNAVKRNTGDNSTLSMDDFFSLIVAQLKNQDMYNTVDNTQFIQQMAQFSMIQALADLSELSLTSYGVSLIGKEVTVAKVYSDGQVGSLTGLVDSVNFYNGSPQVVVEGQSYALSSVMSVNEPKIIIPDGNLTDTSRQDDSSDADDSKDAAGTGNAGAKTGE